MVTEGIVEPFKETKKKVLEIESPFINNDKGFAVAIIITDRVELFIVERRRRGRGVRFNTTFGQPHYFSPSVDNQQNNGAVVTD